MKLTLLILGTIILVFLNFGSVVGNHTSHFTDRHCCADWACYGTKFTIRHEETDHFFVAYIDSNNIAWIEGNFVENELSMYILILLVTLH